VREPGGARIEERSGFETLLSGVSAGLIRASATHIDAALEDGVRQVVAFLGVDRGALDEYLEDEPGVRIRWTAPDVEVLPRLLDDDRFPWSAARLRAGHPVRFACLDDLGEEAAVDRASYERIGTVAHLSLPLRAEGRRCCVLSFDSVHPGRGWDDAFVARLPLLGEAFTNALERGRMDLALRGRLRFESLLSSVSDTFRNLSAADFNDEVPRTLRRIVDFLGVERGALLALSTPDAPTRSWAVDGGVDVSSFPWVMSHLRRGEIVSFSRLANLPDEAAVDRRSCQSLGIASQVAVPLLVGGGVVGALLFGTADAESAWRPDELVQQLQLFGEVFAHALARREGELETQRLRQELAHVGRISAMGELTASLAHELNQPLTSILNNARAAQRYLAAEVVNLQELRDIVSDIITDDKRAAELIRQTRRLLAKGDPEHTALDLNETVAEIARIVTRDAATRHVVIRLDLADALPSVHGDRLQIQQVVLILVLNALDAMQEPGAAGGTLVITTAREDAAVVVSVRDSGTGIDEANVDALFRPLYTTKSEGLGMGLAIASTIVLAHGGLLTATNNPGAGATFRFTLPLGAPGAR
jgi:signal transduction histidine kinase